MKKYYILLLLVVFSSCRTTKDINESYSEKENAEATIAVDRQKIETGEKNTREESDTTTREEYAKTTATKEKEIEYYPPTPDNPQGGVKRSEKEVIYITNEQATKEAIEKAIRETSENYERVIAEQLSIIESQAVEIEQLKAEKSEKDSRPVQGKEWILLLIAGVVSIFILREI